MSSTNQAPTTFNNKQFIFQLLANVGSSSFFGVMLTIGLALGRFWLDIEPTEFAQWFTDYFILLLPCVVITLVPAFAGVIGSYIMSSTDREKKWWQIALAGLIIASLITAVYHLPANFRIWSLEQTQDQIVTELNLWLFGHVFRVGAGLLAAYASFRAVFERTQ